MRIFGICRKGSVVTCSRQSSRMFLEELKKNKNDRMADSGSRTESRLPDTIDQSNCQVVMVGELVIF
jgi:hypothetical protein